MGGRLVELTEILCPQHARLRHLSTARHMARSCALGVVTSTPSGAAVQIPGCGGQHGRCVQRGDFGGCWRVQARRTSQLGVLFAGAGVMATCAEDKTIRFFRADGAALLVKVDGFIS